MGLLREGRGLDLAGWWVWIGHWEVRDSAFELCAREESAGGAEEEGLCSHRAVGARGRSWMQHPSVVQMLPEQARAASVQRPAPPSGASQLGLHSREPGSSQHTQKNDDEAALLMNFTTSAPAELNELLGADSELRKSLPDANFDLESANSLHRELRDKVEPGCNSTGFVDGLPPTASGLGSASHTSAVPNNKRKRADPDTDGRPPPQPRAATSSLPSLGAPSQEPQTQQVWWMQDNKTKAWKEYDARDTAELEHAWEAKQLAASYPSMQLQRRALPQVQGGKFSVNLDTMQQLEQNGQMACKVQRHAITAADILHLPCSKDMLPKPAGPAVAGLLYEIANHPQLKHHTGLSIQVMPNGSLGFRLDLSGKERDEPDIEEKGNHIAELLNAVFRKIGKEVDFGCTSTEEDQAKPTDALPLATSPKDEDSMLALLGPGHSSKANIRTVRVQRCLDSENKPVYKRTIFKWAPNKNGGGKWRRQKRWDSVRKHLSDPVLVPTTIGTVRMQFWSNETGGGQREGDFSQVYTERSGGIRDRFGSTLKRGGIRGSFQRCAELLASTHRLSDHTSWKALFDDVVREKLHGSSQAASEQLPSEQEAQRLPANGADWIAMGRPGGNGVHHSPAPVPHPRSNVLRNLLQPGSVQPQSGSHGNGSGGDCGMDTVVPVASNAKAVATGDYRLGEEAVAAPSARNDNASAAAVVSEMNKALQLESTLSDPRQKEAQSFQAGLMQIGIEGTQSKPLPDAEVFRGMNVL